MEVCQIHTYHDIEELHTLRNNLLRWYDKEKRELPWRSLASVETDPNIRAYGIWVSEVMLQQTQVATVIEYYNRWMKKWPTVEALATATLEEVRTAWSGLGYYSRGERLWMSAQKVVSEMGGVIPDSPEELMKSLPGVGKYTAGAVASIAFNKVASIVDGNVLRVLSRQRVIGGDSSCQAVTKHLWRLAETCVDSERPGDFNQGLMELGATVCTPRSPSCQTCPISSSCLAFKQAQEELHSRSLTNSKKNHSSHRGTEEGLEKNCSLCLVCWNKELGIMNYPHKPKKKTPSVEEFCVAVVEDKHSQFLLRQRPVTGLLAGLWEFPSIIMANGQSHDQSHDQLWNQLQRELSANGDLRGTFIGQVTHHFSHVHHVYHCWHVTLLPEQDKIKLNPSLSNGRWCSKHDLEQSAVPVSVRKIIKLLDPDTTQGARKRPHTPTRDKDVKRQKTLKCFFKQKKQIN